MEQIWIADLTIDQLLAWLEPPRDGAPYTILERVDAIDFPAPEEAIQAEEWTRGRIFGPAFELRWTRRGDKYQVRLTGERQVEPPFTPWTGLEGMDTHDTICLLLERQVQVGVPLHYRALLKGEGQALLRRREFRRQATGALVAERWVGMEREAGR